MMAGEGRVVTVNLPEHLFSKLDEWAVSMDRSKSWIMKQAFSEWLAETERRHEATLEGLRDFDEGRVFTHDEVLARLEERKRERRERLNQN